MKKYSRGAKLELIEPSIEFIFVEVPNHDTPENMLQYVSRLGMIYDLEAGNWDQLKIPSCSRKIFRLKVDSCIAQALINQKEILTSQGVFRPQKSWLELSLPFTRTERLYSEFLIQGVPKDLSPTDLQLILQPIFGNQVQTLKKLKVNLWVGGASQQSKALRTYQLSLKDPFHFGFENRELQIPERAEILNIKPLQNPKMTQWPMVLGNILLSEEPLTIKKIGRLKRKQIELEEDRSLDFQDSDLVGKGMKGCEKPTSLSYYNQRSSAKTPSLAPKETCNPVYRYNMSQYQKPGSRI